MGIWKKTNDQFDRIMDETLSEESKVVVEANKIKNEATKERKKK